MQKIYKFSVLVLFLIGGTLFLFNNFVSNYNQEIEKTKNKLQGVEFAEKIQRLILKLQKLRGYSQFDEISASEKNWKIVQNNMQLIKADLSKDLFEFKKFSKIYPLLYDSDYEHIMQEIDSLHHSASQDRSFIYQQYTYIIEQLKDKMYYIGFKSKLLLESDSDKYFLIETMLKHIPNYIETTGKIRAKTTKAILDKHTDDELRYTLQNSCILCEETSKLVYKTISEMEEDSKKARLLSLLSSVNGEMTKMREYVKKTFNPNQTDIDALDFFSIATSVIDKSFELYSANAEYLSQKLNEKLTVLEKTKLYGMIVGAIVFLFIVVTIISMVRGYMLYTSSENKIKNNLTSIIGLKNELEKCKTISEIASASLYFFASKFNIVQGAIYLFNEENNKLYLASSYATNEMKPIIELGEGLIGEVATQMRYIHTDVSNSKKKHFGIESVIIESSYIDTIPLVSYEKIFGVLQLGFVKKSDIVNNNDFAYFIDMIIGFLRDAKYEEVNKKYIELIDEHVITSKTNTKGIIIDVSQAFTKISGYEKDEIIGKSHAIVSHPDTPRELYQNMWKTILSGKIYSGEIKNRNKNGDEYWIETTITPQIDKYGNILGYSAIIRDITDKKRIEEYSITDALTGLYNRRFYDSNFEKEYKISKRESKNLVLLIIDIDYFKQYNDLYGHQGGDEVLKSVAEAMKAVFKRANDYAYRLGGEEFAISFYADSKEIAFDRAEALRVYIESLNIEHNASSVCRYVTVSIGLTFLVKEQTLDIKDIYKITDESLYRAKHGGRNRVEVTQFNLL